MGEGGGAKANPAPSAREPMGEPMGEGEIPIDSNRSFRYLSHVCLIHI